MKIGNLDIKKAFLGSLQLTSKNAYIGNYKVISGDEPSPVEEWQGFKITSLQNANVITIDVVENTDADTKIYALYTSLDNGQNWKTEFNTQQDKTITYTLNTGDTLCIKADANRWQYEEGAGSSIKSTKTVNVSGNIMSLIYNDDFVDKTTFKDTDDTYTFGYLLSATKVVDASKLELPATTLTDGCYLGMFSGCTSLTTAPELPATSLAEGCYMYMFWGCSSLTTAPTTLPATTPYSYNAYTMMFVGCSSLTTAPELLATTFDYYCCNSMFQGCTNLSEVTVHISGYWNEENTLEWLDNVAPSGTLYNLGGATGIPTDDASGCPTGWTIKTSKLDAGHDAPPYYDENAF